MNKFTHLHVHTEYSLLDGLSRIPELVSRAKELGMDSLALTDHGVMFGALDFYRECKKQGIKPIIGSEVYVASRRLDQKEPALDSKSYHLVLLAKNETGYKNLMKLVSIGYVDGFYRRPRVDHEVLKKYSEGLICLSGCLSGEIPQAIMAGDLKRAHDTILLYQDIFGKENFFLEIQDHRIPEEAKVRESLAYLSESTGAPLVATNDVHYVNKEDSNVHDVLICIQTGAKVADENRMRYNQEAYYLKSPEEMYQEFSYYKNACENTQLIADQCDLEIKEGENHMPVYEFPKEFRSAGEYLRHLSYEGLEKRYPEITQEIRDRLETELHTIDSMGFSNYFLVVWDFIKFAKDNGIAVGPGRGSAAGSLVAYCLNITTLDPLKYSLHFERFLNPERFTMPDIDVDFCYERRQEVIDYVTKKYGKDHVSQIITFGTMAARGSIRDVGRVFDISYNKTDKLAKEIPMRPGKNITIEDAKKENAELVKMEESDPEVHLVLENAEKIEGLARHASTHAAGVVIADKPLTEYVPLYKNGEAITTQFTMGLLESQGLIKMDFLGLKTLTVIRDAVENIKKTTGEEIDLERIDLSDPRIYETIARGDCGGVFQLESSGIIQFMKELKPETFEDIVAGISLYRPGPMDQIPKYIANKKNPENIIYLDKKLEPILDVTYGCMVYQEQIMQIFRDLAGFSMGRSDIVRRAMSKKKRSVMEYEGHVFIHGEEDENGNVTVDGCIRRGIPLEVAEKIWDEMHEFASYGFNKSHAACYAVIACQTAWLKTYYPAEFYAALLSSVMGQEKRISRYIEDCAKRGIEVVAPDVNHSERKFTVKDGKIIYGLGAIKNVGTNFIDSIVTSRTQYGPYESLLDFCERVDNANKRSVLSLIKAGAFDFTGVERGTLLNNAFEVMARGQELKKIKLSGQESFFGSSNFSNVSKDFEMSKTEPLSQDTILTMEKEVLGIYLSGHPLRKYQDVLDEVTYFNFSVLDSFEDLSKAARDQSYVVIGGQIENLRTQLTKRGDVMAFSNLEDQYGSVDLVIFPKTYEQYRSLLKDDTPIIARGKICYDEEMSVSLVVDKIQSLDELSRFKKISQRRSPIQVLNNTLTVNLKDFSQRPLINEIKNILKSSPGTSPVILYFEKEKKRFKAAEALNVNITDKLINKLSSIIN